MKQYFGNYLGLVVNTEDPEKRGRVQVFIPGMMPTLYGDWDQTKKNISFKTFESETFSAGLNIKLKSLLPWAEAAIPFWGGSTGAPINESTGAPTPMPTDQGFNYIYPEEGAGGGGISQQHYGDRKGELGLELQGVIARGLAGTGLNWVSTSGTGYTEKQADGSLHLSGKATDGHFTESVHPYRILDPTTSEEDKGRIAYALSKLTQAGIGGIGYGPGYMGGTIKFHLDIGSYGNWGRDFTFKTQTPWVVNARSGNPQNPPRSNEPPPEAYADTRDAQRDGITLTDGDFNGETEKISDGYANLTPIPANVLKYLASISNFESGWNIDEAYSEKYNQDSNNRNVAQYGKALGSDYGFYQVNGLNVNEARNWGIVNLNTGTFAQQTVATAAYLQRKFPEVYAAVERGDFAEANRIPINSRGQNITDFWFGLKKDKDGTFAKNVDVGKFEEAIRSVDSNPNLTRAQSAALANAVTGGKNVVRTRVPDSYGSIDGVRTGAPMGFTSIPHVGAKVWVFFNGGDIQRPVYFAATYETENIV
jgi:hypothetical protein